jgi:hypothetical protein
MPTRLPSLLIAALAAWFSIVGAMSAPAAVAARLVAARCCATRCHHAPAVAPHDCCCDLTADCRVPATVAAATPGFDAGLAAIRLTPTHLVWPTLTAESVFGAAPARAAPVYLLTKSLRL